MEKRLAEIVVLSDLHLGTYGCRANEILSYLRCISPQMLILNGDIIDIWQVSKHYFPPLHVAIIKRIMDMMTTGTRVVYITGNHDELLRRYTDLKLGNFQLTDKLVLGIDNKMTWIFHGDVFDHTTKGSARFWAKLGSKGYAMLLFANRATNRLLRLIGKERVSLSKKIMAGLNNAIIRIDEFETKIAGIAIQKKYDYVICGHIHQPKKRIISNDHGSVVYMNSGDWVEHLTALEYTRGDWNIYEFEEKLLTPAKIKIINTEPQVVTDDISFYLHYLDVLKRTL